MNDDPTSSIGTPPHSGEAGGVTRSADEIRFDIQLADSEWSRLGLDLEKLTRRCVTTILATAIREVGLPHQPSQIEVSLRFTDDREMRRLNAEYRGVDRSTNVLAFPLSASFEELAAEVLRLLPGESIGLGDVVLARQTVCREAEADGKPLSDHISHLIIHGVLHLLGYDHNETGKAEHMEAVEVEILNRMGIANPYAAAGSTDDA